MSKHFKRRHTLDTETDAGFRDFDPLPRSFRLLMRDNGVSMRQRVGHKVVVSHLKKRVDGSRFVALGGNPGADLCKGG